MEKQNQAIYSISRASLNQLLVEEGEAYWGNFHFEHKCVNVKLSQSRNYI